MARMAQRPGSVVALSHSFSYRAHADRISGFREGLGNYAPGLAISHILEGRDEQGLTEELVLNALRCSPDIVGLYNAGGANRAIEHALTTAGIAGKVVFI